jgi:iron complex transport system substrate-binding protein
MRILAVIVAALAVSCSRSIHSAAGDSAAGAALPNLTTGDGTTLELAKPPVRVIAGNTAAAEIIAPLLGPERIAALPEQVDGYSSQDFGSHGFEKIPRFARYSAEPLIALHPDLVVTHTWQAAETTAVLREQGTPVLVLKSAASYDDVRSTLLACAKLFRLEKRGDEIVAALDARVAALREHAGERAKLRAIVYSNDGSGGWAAGSGTTGDTLVRLSGMRDAAAEAGVKGHASCDFEKLIRIDPDVIVVGAPVHGEGGSATQSVLESTPALAKLTALSEHRIAVLPAALLWCDSQGIVDGAEQLARSVDAMLAKPR